MILMYWLLMEELCSASPENVVKVTSVILCSTGEIHSMEGSPLWENPGSSELVVLKRVPALGARSSI